MKAFCLAQKNHKNVGKEYPFRPWIPTWMKFLVNKLLALMFCVSSHWRLPPSFIIVLFLVIYVAPSRSWTYNHILHPFLWEKKCRLCQNSLAVPQSLYCRVCGASSRRMWDKKYRTRLLVGNGDAGMGNYFLVCTHVHTCDCDPFFEKS